MGYYVSCHIFHVKKPLFVSYYGSSHQSFLKRMKKRLNECLGAYLDGIPSCRLKSKAIIYAAFHTALICPFWKNQRRKIFKLRLRNIRSLELHYCIQVSIR